MYTSLLLFALTGVTAEVEKAPSWQNDYSSACKQCETDQKPMAVFIGSGKAGWDKLGRDGSLDNEAKKILADKYVCVYVDTSIEEGKKLAQSFEMPNGPGIVISDRTGKLQAFRHEGDLSNKTLVSYLDRFATPDRVVRMTETNSSESRVSYYGPTSVSSGATMQAAPYNPSMMNYYPTPAYQMGGYAPSFSGGGYYPSFSSGGGCPGGRCGR